MRNLKNKKAISPVVASIILIAVTVAVSIAVAAWMGALSVGFMQTEQIAITRCDFTQETDNSNNTIILHLRNTGTTDVVINSATVNGIPATITGGQVTVRKNDNSTVTLKLEDDRLKEWKAGDSYQIKLMSTRGNYFVYNAIAPD
ncbi:MAG: archaellin/type IV pilin N-terminal domain-containing protein [Candidatus Bathyarchaeia archaeon]